MVDPRWIPLLLVLVLTQVGCGLARRVNAGRPTSATGWFKKIAQCISYADVLNSRKDYGITIAGEWSNGFNDCGLFLNGVAEKDTVTYGGNCEDWMDSSKWDAATKAGIMQFAKASMSALGDNFFWTWKVRLVFFSSNLIESYLRITDRKV
jgi:hypothetical protein